MKLLTIIGVGTGRDTLTEEARRAIENAELLLGSQRLADEFSGFGKPVVTAYRPADVRGALESCGCQSAAALMSGDVGFYSGASGLVSALEGWEIRLIPGVSTVSVFFARLGIPWQDATLVSAHDGIPNIVSSVRRNRKVFCLTGGNSAEIGRLLSRAGFGGLTVIAGENLGLADEKITRTTVSALENTAFSPLTVLLFINEHPQSGRMGIPDGEFLRLDSVPMTKSEVRAAIAAKLAVSPHDICFDIGAGTGSVTVETALAAHCGHVWAIEKNADASALIRQNCAAFHIGNCTVIEGAAPDALKDLPAPDAVFIGGTGGKIDAIIASVLGKNAEARIVVSAIAVESAFFAIKALESAGVRNIEVVQVGVSRAKRAGGLHMLLAQNPITVISGGGI